MKLVVKVLACLLFKCDKPETSTPGLINTSGTNEYFVSTSLAQTLVPVCPCNAHVHVLGVVLEGSCTCGAKKGSRIVGGQIAEVVEDEDRNMMIKA